MSCFSCGGEERFGLADRFPGARTAAPQVGPHSSSYLPAGLPAPWPGPKSWCSLRAALLASRLTSPCWSPDPTHDGSGPTARPSWEVGFHLSWPFPEALKRGVWGQLQAESALKTQAQSKLLVPLANSHSKDLRRLGTSSRVLSVSGGSK